MAQGVVEIHPSELKFTFELKKQSSCSFHLVNKSDQYVAFKVKTSSPKRYCVRPNTGVILPRSACDFTVTMQAQRTAPPDMQFKDKFLVQTTVVLPGTSYGDLIPSFFSKETNAYIDESKLRVVLVDASGPPAEQLINSVPNTDAAVEVPVSRQILNVENEVPVIEKVVPAPEEQISAVLTDISSPIKQSPILQEVPVIVQEEPAILAESPPPLKNESPPPLKDEYPSPVKDTSAIPTENLLPLKENSVTSKESPLEETLPKESVTLCDRGLFSGLNHQLSHVTEDVQNLKSKLNNLESKLEGTEKMIIKLREESMSMTQERYNLQQEMRDTTGLTNENGDLKLLVQTMEQQIRLQDALNDRLRDEVQQMKIATGQVSANSGKMGKFGTSSYGLDSQSYQRSSQMQSLLAAQQLQQLQIQSQHQQSQTHLQQQHLGAVRQNQQKHQLRRDALPFLGDLKMKGIAMTSHVQNAGAFDGHARNEP